MAKKGGFSGMGGSNMNNMMKQAQKMQKQMADLQEQLDTKTVEATAGGGAVKVVASCKKQIKEITIAEEVVDPEDIEMLQDLIIAAVNEAMNKADQESNGQMSKITGGLNLPGGMF